MTVYAWPALTPPEEYDFWVEPMEGAHGDEGTTASGLVEVIGRFARGRATMSWNNVSVPNALAIEAHLAQLRGRRHATQVPNYKYITKIGTATGAWTVNGDHSRNVESVIMTGGSGAFSAGDLVEIEQMTGVPRSYMILNHTGVTIEISPPLHEAVSSGKAIRHLGDSSTSVIRDTMELIGDVGPATRYPAREPGVVNKRSVDFISARRGVLSGTVAGSGSVFAQFALPYSAGGFASTQFALPYSSLSASGGTMEPVNGSLTQVAMLADSIPQQRWDGFGFTMGGPYDTTALAAAAQANHVQLFDELKAVWTGGYAADSTYAPFAQVCKNNGITGFLATGQCATQYTPSSFADQILATVSSCFWTHASLQNEPDGGNAYEVYAGGTTEIVSKSQDLRNQLNSRGLSSMKVIANGYSHFSGGGVVAEYNALQAAGKIPSVVIAGNGHAYGDNASNAEWDTNTCWANYKPQGMFQTEGGYGDPQTSPARMLSNLNNGVGVYFHFGSQIPAGALPDSDAMAQGLVEYNGTRRPWHYAYQVINRDLTLGSLFRLVHCDDRPPNINATWADRMIRRQTPYIPRLYASVAKRPDGAWWLACCNGTFGADFFNPLGGHYAAHDFQVTFQITELAGINLHWVGRRSDSAGSAIVDVNYDMVDGYVRMTLLAGETVALTTSSVTGGFVSSQFALPYSASGVATPFGDPIPNDPSGINDGLMLFVGGAPSGSAQSGTERISGNPLNFVSGNFTRPDLDFGGWVIPQTTSINGAIYCTRPSTWNSTVGNRYALWMDVIIDNVDNYGSLFAIPWNAGWSPPYVAMGMSRIGTGTAANITYTPAGTMITVNGPSAPASWPASTGRHTIGFVRDGDSVLWFLDGSQAGGTTTGAGTGAPLWTGGSGELQRPICMLARSEASTTANGTAGGIEQLRFWAIPTGTTAAQMISRMVTLQTDRNVGRYTP